MLKNGQSIIWRNYVKRRKCHKVLCNKLKNVIRKGWKDWHVKKERLESVAEHIFGVQMLAIAMKSEYEYDVDLNEQEGNKTMENEKVKALLSESASWSTMWLKFGQQVYPYDDNFKAVSNYAINNNIAEERKRSK